MRILQWKYTACKFNREGANGFHTFAMSEGLSEAEKEELIARAGSYMPPGHLPYQPTAEEIARLFPVTLSFFRLAGGKYAVTSTTYVGQDYGGPRWGNFLSHGLILEEGCWPFYPIELWKSPTFAAGLTQEEILLGRKPEPLAVLSEADIVLAPELSVQRFLEEDETRQAVYESLAASVFGYAKHRQPTVLVAWQEEIPFWIAAVQQTFSVRLAHELSFTTFADSPGKETRISATISEGTAFRADSPAACASFRTHDLVRGRFPRESEERKEEFYLHEVHRLSGLRDFADRFEKMEIGERLNHAAMAYVILERKMWPGQKAESQAAFAMIMELFPRESRRELFDHFTAEPVSMSAVDLRKNVVILQLIAETLHAEELNEEVAVFFCRCMRKMQQKMRVDDTETGMVLMWAFGRFCGTDVMESLERMEWIYQEAEVSEAAREDVAKRLMPVLMKMIREKEEHAAVVRFLAPAGGDPDFARSYVEEVAAGGFYDWQKSAFYESAERGWSPPEDDPDFSRFYAEHIAAGGLSEWRKGKLGGAPAVAFWRFYLDGQREMFSDALAEWVPRFKKKEWEAFANALRELPEGKAAEGEEEIRRLGEMREETEEMSVEKESILGRFLGFFRKR